MSSPALISYIVTNPYVLLQTDFIREIWMIPERLRISNMISDGESSTFVVESLTNLYRGKLALYEGKLYSCQTFQRVDDRSGEYKTFEVQGFNTGIDCPDIEAHPLSTPQDTFILKQGDIANFTGDSSVETTIGIFTANYQFLVYPFGDKIPYINTEITTSKIESEIALRLIDKSVDTATVKRKYIDSLYTFSQNCEIFSPNISEKTITIPPEIHDLRRRLVLENKEALEAGDASVMTMIEQTLIKTYKDYLKNDPSMHFLLKKKYFNVTLKKLFLTQGMVEVFGQEGKFTFVDNPMGSGWQVKDLPVIFDEVRQGSYARAVETQDGGTIAKFILRILQDTRIDIPDCGTKHGEHIHATKDQLIDFMWNYVITETGETVIITKDTMDQFLGRDIVIRTPGFCESQHGFCAKCFGKLFEELGFKAFAPIANDFARNQTTKALKSMHGKSHDTVDISDINRYLTA